MTGDDPFDDIDPDDVADREGDPFEALDGDPGDDDRPPGPDAEGADASTDDGGATGGPPMDDWTVDVSGDPFGDVDVSRGDPFESDASSFASEDVDAVDPDAVWDRFTATAESAARDGSSGEDVTVVPKHRFCETCPHFSDPPEVRCTHDGTTILAFVGPDDVRVADCPVVRERRELGELDE